MCGCVYSYLNPFDILLWKVKKIYVWKGYRVREIRHPLFKMSSVLEKLTFKPYPVNENESTVAEIISVINVISK